MVASQSKVSDKTRQVGEGGGQIWYKTCTLAQHDELIFGTNVKSLFKKNWDEIGIAEDFTDANGVYQSMLGKKWGHRQRMCQRRK